ncbi:MAG: response regulator receiver protein [Acidobacteria bacterium]|jgi:CheY-like chemotaxis protein|nr:response regulator receiver protein [Acidobacteriota bacterium]
MTRTILLADDSVTIQKVVELTFLDEDFRVVAVGDGAEAIGRLQEVRPELVIADVHMPGADGYEVADAVAKTLPGTPTLLLVGTFEVFDTERAAAVGAAGHLKKPFDSQDLLRRAKELLAGAPAQAAARRETIGPATPVPVAPAEASATFEEMPVFEPVPALEPVVAAFPPAAPAPAPPPLAVPLPAPAGAASLSDAEVERIAARVAELIGDRVVRDVAWEVVPDLAEVLLKARIRELEASVE